MNGGLSTVINIPATTRTSVCLLRLQPVQLVNIWPSGYQVDAEECQQQIEITIHNVSRYSEFLRKIVGQDVQGCDQCDPESNIFIDVKNANHYYKRTNNRLPK